MISPDRQWTIWWSTEGRDALIRLLSRAWDPIFRGVGSNSRDDEYADHADQIGARLRLGMSADELADWLVETEATMHLQPGDDDRNIDLDVAQIIIAWYERVSPGHAD